jgi:hypothetical protein
VPESESRLLTSTLRLLHLPLSMECKHIALLRGGIHCSRSSTATARAWIWPPGDVAGNHHNGARALARSLPDGIERLSRNVEERVIIMASLQKRFDETGSSGTDIEDRSARPGAYFRSAPAIPWGPPGIRNGRLPACVNGHHPSACRLWKTCSCWLGAERVPLLWKGDVFHERCTCGHHHDNQAPRLHSPHHSMPIIRHSSSAAG